MSINIISIAAENPVLVCEYGSSELIYSPKEAVDYLINVFGYWNGDGDNYSFEELLTLSEPYLQYALEQLEKRIPEALRRIVSEVEEQTICEVDGIPSDLFREMFGSPDGEIARSKRKRGGARKRKGVVLQTDEECAEFAKLVDNLRPLWKYLTDFFEREGYDLDSQEAVKLTPKYKTLSSSCKEIPQRLINEARLREVHKDRGQKIPREIQPQGLAFKHAAHELGFAHKYKYDTLKKRYERGNRALEHKLSVLSLQP